MRFSNTLLGSLIVRRISRISKFQGFVTLIKSQRAAPKDLLFVKAILAFFEKGI